MVSTDYQFLVSIVVPCFNEEDNIDVLVTRVQKVFDEHSIEGELILVNDASHDGTQEKIDKALKSYKNVRSFTHNVNKGIFQGWVTGVHNALGKYVVIIDADLQYDPQDIATLYHEILNNRWDIVQGWRKNYHDSALRRFLKTSFSKLLGVVFNCRLEDIKSGFIICRKEVFTDILSYKLDYKFPQHYLTISGISKKYTIKQIPITFGKRYAGDSFITQPLLFSLKAFFELPKAFYEFQLLNRKNTERA